MYVRTNWESGGCGDGGGRAVLDELQSGTEEVDFFSLEVDVYLVKLMLKCIYNADASIHRITEPHLRLIREGIDGVFALTRVKIV